ncbi:winged helix-turn-helix transcriptional regulator [Ensifer sp. ENS04]|uniref:autorepressor SdpR family transcription factor n=1 Tax=Ensifer sp. ENS04 TaxID=2769281 RepID=UPI00177A9D4F|nr:autorepressor SdpR family transcription factor [Ensifer sp. ENS04]MBD9538953.1 winged helix-turn-helix transcriptional regulator [Ensifer sp. ENS04]
MDGVFKAISDPTRREILQLLRERDMTAGEIARHFKLSKPTLTSHFSVLRQAGLIRGEKSGTRITYSHNLAVLKNTLATFAEGLQMEMDDNVKQ